MSQGQPAQSQTAAGRPRDRKIHEGDIVVTAVAKHYVIGRIVADRETQEAVGTQPTRADAVKQACAFAGRTHQVFLYPDAGTSNYLRVDTAAVQKAARAPLTLATKLETPQ